MLPRLNQDGVRYGEKKTRGWIYTKTRHEHVGLTLADGSIVMFSEYVEPSPIGYIVHYRSMDHEPQITRSYSSVAIKGASVDRSSSSCRRNFEQWLAEGGYLAPVPVPAPEAG